MSPLEHNFINSSNSTGKLIFFGFFMLGVGTASSILLWPKEDNHIWYAFISTVLLCIYISAYAVTATRADNDTATRNQIADNAYYLGFLYTITTVAIALVIVSLTDSNNRAGQNIELLIGFMGVALVTTIVGVAARTVLIQVAVDTGSPGQQEYTSEEIMERVQATGERLNNILHEFENSSNTMLESVRGIQENVDKMDRFRSSIDEVINNFPDRFQNSLDGIPKTLDKVGDSLATNLESQVNRFHETIQGELSKAQNLGEPLEELNDKFKNIVLTMERDFKLSEHIDGMNEILKKEFDRANQLYLPVDELNQALGTMVTRVENELSLTSFIERLNVIFDREFSKLNQLNIPVENINSRFREMMLSIDKLDIPIGELKNVFDSMVSRAESELSLKPAIDRLNALLDEEFSRLKQLDIPVDDINTRFKALMESIDKLGLPIDELNNAFSSMVSRAENELSLTPIIERLNGLLNKEFSKFDQLDIPVEAINSKFNTLLESMRKLDIPADQLNHQFQMILEQLEQAAERINRVDIKIDLLPVETAIKEVSGKLSQASAPVSNLNQDLISLQDSLKALERKISNVDVDKIIRDGLKEDYLQQHLLVPLEQLGSEIILLKDMIENLRREAGGKNRRFRLFPFWRQNK